MRVRGVGVVMKVVIVSVVGTVAEEKLAVVHKFTATTDNKPSVPENALTPAYRNFRRSKLDT